MSDPSLDHVLPSRSSRGNARSVSGRSVCPAGAPGWTRLLPVLVALLACPLSGGTPGDQEIPDPHLADLVVDLGHETWSRREAAQNLLFRRREQATALLREALSSENLERASRARYLLDTLDPLLGHFQIVKIRLGDAPRVTATGAAEGKAREELSIAPRDLLPLGEGSAAKSPSRYTVFFTVRHDGELEILVNRTLGAYSSDTMNAPLAEKAAISLLVRTEECHYREVGVYLERERRRFLTLLRVRYGRSSDLSDARLSSDPDDLLESLMRELRTQAASGSPQARASAIEILSYLAPGKADDVFAAAVEDPALRPLAILGLDRPQDLGELVVLGSGGPAAVTLPKLPPPGIRAAARLLHRGDTAHLPFLLDRLAQDNPEHLHFAMAAIADFVDARASEESTPHGTGLTEAARQLLVRRTFSKSFFSHAVWQNRETAYFVDRIGSLVDAGAPEEVARVEQSLARLEGMVHGGSGAVRITLDVCRPIWRRLAARLPSPPSERAMLFRLLPSMLQGVSISRASQLLDEALAEGPLSDSELDTLLETLLDVREANPRITCAVLVGTLRTLQLEEGQLRTVVAATLDVADSIAGSESGRISGSSTSTRSTRSTSIRSAIARRGRLFPQIAERLRYLTGVSIRTGSRDLGPWRSWLDEEEKVREQEEKLLALQKKGGASGVSLLFFEFDLVVEPPRRNAAGRSLPADFELADGRMLQVTVGEVFSYRDRWGNTVHRRLRERPQLLRGSSLKSRSRLSGRRPPTPQPSRFRFDDSRVQYTLGVPTLRSMTARDVRSTCVETSALYLGSRIISGRASSSYRTVVLLTEPGVERPPAGNGLPALWDWFLETHVLRLPDADEASAGHLRALAQIFRTLKIAGAGAVMSAIFDHQPSHQLARDLHDAFGDRKGIAYYRSLLPTLTGVSKLYAARLLAEFGDVAAVDILMDDGTRGSLPSLDRYLQLPSTPPDERARVLDFLVKRMKLDSSITELRQIFATLGREANDDFGFTAAVRTNDPREKRAGIRKAIEEARTWRRRLSAAKSSEDSR